MIATQFAVLVASLALARDGACNGARERVRSGGNSYVCAAGLHVITGLKADPTHASKYDHDMNTNFCSLASDDGKVILSMTEPRRGAAVPSPLQTFIDHNHGTGVHHLALVPRDIFATVRAMRAMGADGLAFMPHPPAAYYECATRSCLRMYAAVT